MASLRVRRSGKDQDGDITSLCSDWGVVLKSRAIREIKAGTNRYYVEEASPAVDVKVRTRSQVEYLTTEADSVSRNNLDNLPDC